MKNSKNKYVRYNMLFLFLLTFLLQSTIFVKAQGVNNYETWVTGPHTDGADHYTIKVKGHIDYDWSTRDDELDNTKIYYFNENGTYSEVFHGDCDGSWNWQKFSSNTDLIDYSSSYKYTHTDGEGHEHEICYVEFKYHNLPSDFDNIKELRFKVYSDWDAYADNTNSGYDHTNYFNERNPRSKHYYNENDIEFYWNSNTLEFNILGQFKNIGRNEDELRDIKIYYTDVDGNETRVFHGDYDYSDPWQMHSNDSYYTEKGSYYTRDNSRYVDHNRGRVNFFADKVKDDKLLNFRVEVIWYIDQNNEERTYEFTYEINNNAAEHIYVDENIQYSLEGNNDVGIDILGHSYNPGTDDDELDDIKIYYTLPNESEQYLFSGDCDNNNAFDLWGNSISKLEKDGADILTGNTTTGFINGKFNFHLGALVGNPEYATIKATYDWDANSDQVNAGADGDFYYKIRTGVYTSTLFDNNAEKLIVTCNLNNLTPPTDNNISYYPFNNYFDKLIIKDENDQNIGNAILFNNGELTYNITSDKYIIDEENTYFLEFLDANDNVIFRREHTLLPEAIPINLEVSNVSYNKLYWAANDAYTNVVVYRKVESGSWEDITINISQEADNEYHDNFNLQSCTLYTYRINYKIDDKDYQSHEITIVTPNQDNVKLINFDASKLEYSDKIALSWERNGDGVIEVYKIRREIDGVEGSVKTIFVSDNQNVSSFIDEQTQPGLLYKYSLAGYATCDVATTDDYSLDNGKSATWGGTSITIDGVEHNYKSINDVLFDGGSVSSPYTAGSNGTLTVDGVKEQESVTGPVISYGIRQPLGSVGGQIAFGQGSPVEGVKVVVEKAGSDSRCIGKAVELTGNDSIVISHYRDLDNKELDIDEGYTLETWIKHNSVVNSGIAVLMSKKSWVLTYNYSTGQISVNGTLVVDTTSFNPYVYNHYAVKVYTDGVELILNDTVYTKVPVSNVLDNTDDIILGLNASGKYDEIRLWNNSIENEQIINDFDKLINGNEPGLLGYWRLDDGVSDLIIDMSQNSQTYEYNKNHGKHYGISVDADISSSKLSLCAITNSSGNYQVKGIGFKGLGQNFTIVPMKGIHKFSPGNRPIYISGDNLNHNSKDFTDVSSFPVSGVVKYLGYEYPVKGVSILVDGKEVIGDNNSAVVTDKAGEFTVQVPIGTHTLGVKKLGHNFEDSTYTEQLSDGTITEDVYFDHAITGVEFFDTTTVKLCGRVVGGLIQGDTVIGFNLSENNIGVAEITLNALNESLDISKQDGQQNSYTFTTDSSSGEYVQYLLPESYIIKSVKPENSNNVFSFSSDDYGVLDISDAWHNDSVAYKFDANSPEIAVDSFKYNVIRNFIYRAQAQILVTNMDGGHNLFETEYEVGGETIQLIDGDGDDVFGHPILDENTEYSLNFLAYEKYENNEEGADLSNDSVPVSDGVVQISTSLAHDHKLAQRTLDKTTGSASYKFYAGEPNLTVNEDSTLNYLQQITASYIIDGEPIDWEGTYAYVLGSKVSGTNFVTAGNIETDFILRDPPGDASYAYIEEGSTLEHSYSRTDSKGATSETSLSLHLGTKVTTNTGLPGATVAYTFERENNINGGLTTENKWTSADDYTTTSSFTSTISTSSDPTYVGSMADIFIGHATNILFGTSNTLSINSLNSGFVDSINTVYNNRTIGTKKVISVGEQFATNFIYTQNHIINYLIPNIEEMRNNFLRNDTTRYVNKKQSESDEYGNNNNEDIDSVYVTTTIPDVGDIAHRVEGDSYWYYPYSIHINDSITFWETNGYDEVQVELALQDMWTLDSVRFCNTSVSKWEDMLADNERGKIESELERFEIPVIDENDVEEAEEDDDEAWFLDGDNIGETESVTFENISFDAGAKYEAVLFIEQGHNEMHAREYTVAPHLGFQVGNKFNKFGYTIKEKITYVNSDAAEENTNELRNMAIGFVLADSDQGDYYTVDVRNDQSGNSPVFKLKGGQSSCPYHDKESTQYYSPGEILNNSTAAIEVPSISVTDNSIDGVPVDIPAIFSVQLKNDTEAGLDKWYLLMVDPQTNINGAKVTVAGVNLSKELAVLIPANASLSKIVEVTKPANADTTGVINLILHSMCQFDPSDDIADISDTVSISASFEPVCTDISLIMPADKWIVNANDNSKMNVEIGNYNNQMVTFEKVIFQYRAETSSQWIPQYVWYKDSQCDTYKNETSLPANYSFIDKVNKLIYEFDMDELNNGKYQLRVKSICTDGSVNYSLSSGGIFDNNRPQVHGVPEPGDGILSSGEVISVKFNETINQGAILKSYNFDIQGVLNNHAIDNSVSIQFDGAVSSVSTSQGIILNNKTFTIEFNSQINSADEGAIISYGNLNNNSLLITKSADGFNIIINNTKFVIATTTDEHWHHYALRYDGKETIAFIKDGEMLQEFTIDLTDKLKNANMLTVGNTHNYSSFRGSLYNVRIWSTPRTDGELYDKMLRSLSGTEYGLISYYPLDKGYGDVFVDKTGSRHATGEGVTWHILPSGNSFEFNGSTSLLMDCSTLPLNKEKDITIELWFKVDNSANDKVLFSNGTLTSQTMSADSIKIVNAQFTSSGYIEILSNKKVLKSRKIVTDNKWHHLALAVNRRSNAILFIDNELQSTIRGDEFGNIETGSIMLGARMQYVNDTEVQISDFLNGFIDEVRVWETARASKSIEINSHTTLNGNEMGLVAYYPFEKHNDKGDVISTLQNQYIAEDMLVLKAEGATQYSELSAGIKLNNHISKLTFDYTINDDEIIIIPTSDQASLMENCVIEITVKGIKDMQGNTMASPVTWTAFVKKNSLLWDDNIVSVNNEVGRAYHFSAKIINTGGTSQNFTISNLPIWLSADTEIGVLPPNSEQYIKFDISNALSIGDYNNDIYLTGDAQYNEKLTLLLNIFKKSPTWTVDEKAYKSSMNIIAKLSVKDVISSDENDMIGVFVGDECRGVCNLEYKSNYNSYFAFLVVYGDTNNEQLVYKVWDASEGKIYTDISPNYNFESNKLYGTASDPIIFNVGDKITNSIDLNKGWSWLSFNLYMNDPSVQAIFGKLDSKSGDVVKYASVFSSFDDSVNVWDTNSLATIGLGNKYNVRIQNGGVIKYSGVEVECKDYPITLVKGWNRIGYMPSQNMPINEALSGFEPQINDILKSQYQFAMYDGYEWIGSLNYMQQGRGYMYSSSNTDTIEFVYPEAKEMSKKGLYAIVKPIAINYGVEAGDFEYVMNITAQVTGSSIPDGYLLGAYINNELRGVENIYNDVNYNNYSFITVYGSKNEYNAHIEFKLLRNDEKVVLSGVSGFALNNCEGNLTYPVELNFEKSVSTLGINNQFIAYPNPFSNNVTISYYVKYADRVTIEVYNIVGEKIDILINEYKVPGDYTLIWDGKISESQYAKQGVYFIHYNIGNVNSVVKIIKE